MLISCKMFSLSAEFLLLDFAYKSLLSTMSIISLRFFSILIKVCIFCIFLYMEAMLVGRKLKNCICCYEELTNSLKVLKSIFSVQIFSIFSKTKFVRNSTDFFGYEMSTVSSWLTVWKKSIKSSYPKTLKLS